MEKIFNEIEKPVFEMLEKSGEVIKKHFRKQVDIKDKQDSSPVTIADSASELEIRKIIEKKFPNHGIVGEEHGKKNENSEFVWVIDPIDGTKSFITGTMCFGTLIALLHQKEPIFGVINQPITNECWVGKKGHKTLFNSKEIQTRKCEDIKKATVFASSYDMFKGKDKQKFETLLDKTKLARFSTDCYGYGLLALGFADIVCEADMNLYDFASLVPIIKGAGGDITDWKGGELSYDSDGRVLAVGDKNLQKQLFKILG